jgi:predicted secreted Zn-dependent protease
MNRAGPAAVVMAATMMLFQHGAAAKPLTNYVHYLIGGNSPEGLYKSMISNGPLVGGGKAYASTRMDPKVTATTVATRESCLFARCFEPREFRPVLYICEKARGRSSLDLARLRR